ncbi:glutaredoxin-like protein NrdH [Oceanobacillus oncorhynchi subsp. oncorhynchi]
MIKVYTKNNCPQCDMTKTVLEGEGLEFQAINIEEDNGALEYIKSMGFQATPVIVAEGVVPFSGFRPDKLLNLK